MQGEFFLGWNLMLVSKISMHLGLNVFLASSTLLIFWNTLFPFWEKKLLSYKTKQQKSSLHSTSNCNLYPPYFRLAAYLLEPPKKSQQIKISQSAVCLQKKKINGSQQQEFLHLKKTYYSHPTTTTFDELLYRTNYTPYTLRHSKYFKFYYVSVWTCIYNTN